MFLQFDQRNLWFGTGLYGNGIEQAGFLLWQISKSKITFHIQQKLSQIC